MVLETRSALESAAVGSGHSFAATRLDAQRSIAGWIGEQTGGLSYLESIRQLAKRVDSNWEGVQADLQFIRYLQLHCCAACAMQALALSASHVFFLYIDLGLNLARFSLLFFLFPSPIHLQDCAAAAAWRHRQHDG